MKKKIQGSAQSFPTSYTKSGSISGSNYTYCIGKGSDTANSSGNDYASGSNTSTAYIVYSFEDLKIPDGATIKSVSVTVKGHLENTSRSTAKLQLYSGSTAKGSESKFSSTSDAVITMSPGTWTAAELNDAKLRFTIGYYGGKVVGVTWTVEYEIEKDVYVVTASSEADGMTIAPASTEADSGDSVSLKIRGESVDGLILADNGSDVTASLVEKQASTEMSYTVDAVEGASYGFALANGWYVSQNKGLSNTAALARINLKLPVRCKVTITYINYAEAGYDFGIFSKVDTALTLKYPVSTQSGGDQTIDDGLWELKLIDSNSSGQQTYDYTVDEGEHFIDVKFGKDAGTSSGNDTLQFKVSITPLEEIIGGSYWEYVVSNIVEDHVIVLTSAGGAWVRINGVWRRVERIYKRIGGKWVEQQDMSALDQRSTPWKHVRHVSD